MAIDRLPSGRFRGRLMIDRQRYTATLPTDDDARIWEIEARAAAAVRRRAASATFAEYAAGWLAGFIEDAPDRASFEAALEYRLLAVVGELLLLELLDADRDEPHRQLVDAGVGGGMTMPRGSVWACSARMPPTTCVPGFWLPWRRDGRVGQPPLRCVNRYADGTVHASSRGGGFGAGPA